MKHYIYAIIIGILLLTTGCNSNNDKEAAKIETLEKEVIQMSGFSLTSSVFSHNGNIPSKYTCQGDDTSPPLDIKKIPEGTKSLALIVDDPDAPGGDWVHWVLFNMPLVSDFSPNSFPDGAIQGKNDFGKITYGGPCPPSGTHRYFFKLYALDSELNLDQGATKSEVEAAMQGHIIEKAELVGLYKK